MKKFQRAIISFFTFVGGLYFFLEFILPKEIHGFEFGAYHEQILKGIQIVGIMAIGLGIISILKVHSRSILGLKKGWINSFSLLAGFFLMLAFQGVNFFEEREANTIKKRIGIIEKFIPIVLSEESSKPIEPRLLAIDSELNKIESELSEKIGDNSDRHELFSKTHMLTSKLAGVDSEGSKQELLVQLGVLEENVSSTLDKNVETSFSKRAVDLFNNGLFVPLGSAMFALLAFYIANAAYRSFRVRSLESFLLMTAAIIVMLGQIPQGPMYISESLPAIRLWLLKNISTPAFRAIFFGSSIAGLAMAIRIWFSLENGPLNQDSDGRGEN